MDLKEKRVSLIPINLLSVSDALLKKPEALILAARHQQKAPLLSTLFLVAFLSFGLTGLIVGSCTGDSQNIVMSLKFMIGGVAAGLITLPSLYIFSALSGSDFTLRETVNLLLCCMATIGLIMLGLAPIGWIISQSTDSPENLAAVLLIFYLSAIGLGMMRGLRLFAKFGCHSGYLKIWMIIFVLVCFQIASTLRPMEGTAAAVFQAEKQFFLKDWVSSLKKEDW